MKAIALRAGIESLEIVSEPEAAAVYFQYDTKRKNPMSDKLAGFDEPFLVLDIGGGTAVSASSNALRILVSLILGIRTS